jgi:hypothetical protein
MTKIIDKKAQDQLFLWHGKYTDPDICIHYSDTHDKPVYFNLTIPEAEEFYVKLGELIIRAKNYRPLQQDDEE